MRLAEALTILNQPADSGTARIRVALACGFMPLHLQTFLAARLRQATGRLVGIETGLYGDLVGNLERSDHAAVDAMVVVVEWSDLDPRLGLRSPLGWRITDVSDILSNARARVLYIQQRLQACAASASLILLLPSLPLPPLETFVTSWQAGQLELALYEILNRFALGASSIPGVKIISSTKLANVSPPATRFDVRSELLSGFPYSLSHADAVSEAITSLLYSVSPKKGLITDLDDTLWKGIVGEVGVEQISWNLDHHSHMHAVYQEFLGSLARTGVLLAVASKNDPDRVEEAFRRPDLLLPKNRIFPFEVHWGPKSASIGRILKTWNIASDSVVFVDDSPIELAEVKSVYPDIECVLFPKAPQEVYSLLGYLRDRFAKPALLEEDRLRLDSIRANRALQEHAQTSPADPDAFLKAAEGVLTIRFDKAADPRVLELLNKTNQFNLNGKRFTESTLAGLLADPCVLVMKASYSDRFAPLGKIAVLIGRMQPRGLKVLSWVMSCRAFSRRIEHAFLSHLFAKFPLTEIEFDYLSTPKNTPLQEFLTGFLGPIEKQVTLTRARFDQHCPSLFHRLEEEL